MSCLSCLVTWASWVDGTRCVPELRSHTQLTELMGQVLTHRMAWSQERNLSV